MVLAVGRVSNTVPVAVSDHMLPYDVEALFTYPISNALFVWLISHQPAVLFSQNKPAISNQPTILFSQNKTAPAISHLPNEQSVKKYATLLGQWCRLWSRGHH
jgi:hypothetical protein